MLFLEQPRTRPLLAQIFSAIATGILPPPFLYGRGRPTTTYDGRYTFLFSPMARACFFDRRALRARMHFSDIAALVFADHAAHLMPRRICYRRLFATAIGHEVSRYFSHVNTAATSVFCLRMQRAHDATRRRPVVTAGQQSESLEYCISFQIFFSKAR